MKRKVLIFVDWFEPGFKAGGPIQSCRNLVEALGDQFDFYIFTGDRDFGDSEPYSGIDFNTWIDYKGKAKVYYLAGNKPGVLSVRKLIKSMNPDVVYLNNMYSVGFSQVPILAMAKLNPLPKIVLAPRGMLQGGAVRQKYLKKIVFLTLLRLSGIPKKIVFQATDEQEMKDVQKYFPNAAEIALVGNIPDLKPSIRNNINKNPGELKCVFLSRIQEKKNLLFILELLKEFSSKEDNIYLDIYGKPENEEYWNKCLQLIETMPSNVKINYKGPVNHNQVLPTLASYHLFILPTFAENFGHAIFESLKVGTPILISNNTPWLNIEEQGGGWDIPLDNKEAYIKAIKFMVDTGNEEFKKMSEGAAGVAENYLKNNDFYSDYINLFS